MGLFPRFLHLFFGVHLVQQPVPGCRIVSTPPAPESLDISHGGTLSPSHSASCPHSTPATLFKHMHEGSSLSGHLSTPAYSDEQETRNAKTPPVLLVESQVSPLRLPEHTQPSSPGQSWTQSRVSFTRTPRKCLGVCKAPSLQVTNKMTFQSGRRIPQPDIAWALLTEMSSSSCLFRN